MHGKYPGFCTVLLAVAVVAIIPAIAIASPLLKEGLEPVAVNSKITATGLNSAEWSSGFETLKCNDYWLTGEVIRNETGLVTGTIEKASFNSKHEAGATEDCSSTVGATKVTIPGFTNEGGTQHWCLEATAEALSGTTGEGSIAPHSCGGTGGSFTFVRDITNLFGSHVICRYNRTTNLPIDLVVGSDLVSLRGEPEFSLEAASSSSCSSTGKFKQMSFTLEIDESPFSVVTIG